ncbi:MAG: hypothetical protein ACUVUS_01680 [Thermoproteota archaeon]
MFRESIFKGLTKREAEDLINAIKHDKYWRIVPEVKDFVCVIALSRARIRSRRGMYAKVTYLRRVEVSRDAAKFCRKWRVLLVDTRSMLAISVLTWKAFNKIVLRGMGPIIYYFLMHDKLPPYFNTNTISKILRNGHIP